MGIFVVAQKRNGVAAGSAAEAVIKLFVWAYAERGRFFFVEWAASCEIFSTSFEGYAGVNKADDIGASQYFFDEWLGNMGGHVFRKGILIESVWRKPAL